MAAKRERKGGGRAGVVVEGEDRAAWLVEAEAAVKRNDEARRRAEDEFDRDLDARVAGLVGAALGARIRGLVELAEEWRARAASAAAWDKRYPNAAYHAAICIPPGAVAATSADHYRADGLRRVVDRLVRELPPECAGAGLDTTALHALAGALDIEREDWPQIVVQVKALADRAEVAGEALASRLGEGSKEIGGPPVPERPRREDLTPQAQDLLATLEDVKRGNGTLPTLDQLAGTDPNTGSKFKAGDWCRATLHAAKMELERGGWLVCGPKRVFTLPRSDL